MHAQAIRHPQMRAAPYPGATPMGAQQFLPPDPNAMLIRQRSNPFRWMASPLVIVIALLVFAEVSAPVKLKPSNILGDAAGRFYGGIMQAANEKELDLMEQTSVAQALGVREAQRSNFDGLCAASGVLDLQLGHLCQRMTDAYFAEALPPARTYRDRYRGHLR